MRQFHQSKTILKAKNPHNQFILDSMHEMKMRCLRSGQDKVSFLYQKIIYALLKYPVPILCEEQINQLSGVGEKTSCIILKLVNQQYHDYENMFGEMSEAIKLDVIAEQLEDDYDETYGNSCPPSMLFNISSSNGSSQSSGNINASLGFGKRKDLNTNGGGFLDQLNLEMRKQVQSENEKRKAYNPSKNSKGWAIMMGMHKFQSQENKIFASKKEIKDYTKNFDQDINNWMALDTLEKHGLVQRTVLENQTKYALTDYGNKMAEKYTVEDQLVKKYFYKNPEQQQEGTVIDQEQGEIILLIDNRERFHSTNRGLIFEKMKNIYEVNCRLTLLPVGDFMWVKKIGSNLFYIMASQQYSIEEEYVMDYVVERKTIPDLASSIIDKRYSEQKYRLKCCGLRGLFYLIENHQGNKQALPRSTLDKAIRNTQLRDGFFVQQTENLEQSLLWLSRFTKSLKEPKCPLQTLSNFIASNSQRSDSIFNVWGSMLRCVNGVGLEAAKQIAYKWSTPSQFYEAINKEGADLNNLLTQEKEDKKYRTIPSGVLRTVEVLFTAQDYLY